MKAQFDSQTVLLNECLNHFDKSIRLVTITDESLQRHFLSQFKQEWDNLEELLKEKELQLHRYRIEVVPVPQLLEETQDTLNSIEVALKDIDTQVTSIQQLRDISEKYKVLRIKILNSKDNLEHLQEVTSGEEEPNEELQDTLYQLKLTCEELVCTIQQRIASLEYVLENVQKTISRVERMSLTMMHLESTLERCKAIDEEGEQLLKAALHSCKTIYEGLACTEKDIIKVKQCMEMIRKDPNHPCHLVELEDQISSLQDRLKSLSKAIEVTKANLKDRLELWQQYMQSSEAVDNFLQKVEYLMDSAVGLPYVNLQSLQNHLNELHGLQDTMTDKEKLLDELRSEAIKVEETTTIEKQITRWNNVSDRLVKVS